MLFVVDNHCLVTLGLSPMSATRLMRKAAPIVSDAFIPQLVCGLSWRVVLVNSIVVISMMFVMVTGLLYCDDHRGVVCLVES